MKKTVCGLDVHKDSVFCCILCADGRKVQNKFGVLTEELITLRDLMESEGVEECAMESTSIYWMPIWRALESSVNYIWSILISSNSFPAKKRCKGCRVDSNLSAQQSDSIKLCS